MTQTRKGGKERKKRQGGLSTLLTREAVIPAAFFSTNQSRVLLRGQSPLPLSFSGSGNDLWSLHCRTSDKRIQRAMTFWTIIHSFTNSKTGFQAAQAHYAAKDDPKFTILLPPPPHLPGLQPYHARFMQCCVRNPNPYLDARDVGILPAQAASQPANDIFKQVA